MIIYTKHAEGKFTRGDIKKFKINKKFVNKNLRKRKNQKKTRYGNYSTVTALNKTHDLRIIYDIIGKDLKVITFHVTRKGRY